MHVVATAGHVDHGKSTLVRRLTGRDPDRLEEERRRGLTVDLGFAWTSLAGGVRVAFVDVPGHQRFVPTMLAGAGPVPAVMFVVAADEGWCAQSTEHLAALDALEVRHGLLVVTRSDLADPEPARAQALERLQRTSLGRLPSVAVSGRTGRGIDDLLAGLDALVRRLPEADTEADVRLWVDRSFTVRGAGTVVTGTLAAGTLRVGRELWLPSASRTVRVRGLQSLERECSTVPAAARVAVNLRGVERAAVRRGDALLDPAGWLTASEVDVALRRDSEDPALGPTSEPAAEPAAEPAPGPAPELPRRLMLHLGSAAVGARVRPLGRWYARLRLDRPLPVRFGDRGLLRDPGRHRVAAGVLLLDVAPPALTRRGAARERAAELSGILAAGEPPVAAAELRLALQGFLRASELRAEGLPAAGRETVPGWLVDRNRWRALTGRVRPECEAWECEHPVSAGLPVEDLRRRLALPDTAVAEALVVAAGLDCAGGRVVRAGARPSLPESVERAVRAVEADLASAPFVAPDANRLAELGLGAPELAAAVRAERLIRIADRIVLAPDAPGRAEEVLAGLDQPFTLGAARQALGTTRRVAVPLLESLARAGRTRRLPDGTHRVLP